jgi:hypothetical protein
VREQSSHGSLRSDFPDARWREVESSAVSALAFVVRGALPMRGGTAADTRYGDLLVEYRNGRVYAYPRQHPAVFDAILSAESIGGAVAHFLN